MCTGDDRDGYSGLTSSKEPHWERRRQSFDVCPEIPLCLLASMSCTLANVGLIRIRGSLDLCPVVDLAHGSGYGVRVPVCLENRYGKLSLLPWDSDSTLIRGCNRGRNPWSGNVSVTASIFTQLAQIVLIYLPCTAYT